MKDPGSKARAEVGKDIKKMKKQRAKLTKEIDKLETKSRAKWEKATQKVEKAKRLLIFHTKKAGKACLLDFLFLRRERG